MVGRHGRCCCARVQNVVRDALGWGGQGGLLEAGDILLAIRLLHKKSLGDSSEWAPYVAALPNPSRSPLQWSAGKVSVLLTGLLLADDALVLQGSIDRALSVLADCFKTLPASFPPSSFSASAWRWAVATVRSRAIPASTIKGMDPALGMLLIPGVDLATAVCNGGRRATAVPFIAQDHKPQLQQVAHMHLAKGACGVALEADGAWKCREEEEEGLEEGVGLCAVGG